jgi:hypothetical protein
VIIGITDIGAGELLAQSTALFVSLLIAFFAMLF